MMKYEKNVYEGQNVYLQYYEIRNGLKPLVLLHAQAVDSTSYFGVMPKLAQHFHVYAVDCYGHGGSLHDASKYNVTDIGNAVISFIQNVIQEPVCLLGHSSGGHLAMMAVLYNACGRIEMTGVKGVIFGERLL